MKWQGFGVSGVPQLFGERVIVAGAGAATVCAWALARRSDDARGHQERTNEGHVCLLESFNASFIAAYSKWGRNFLLKWKNIGALTCRLE